MLFRVATYLQKHGGSSTSEDMWGVFGKDEGISSFLKKRGGSCHWCRHHPGVFTVEGSLITLIGKVGSFSSWGGGGEGRGSRGGYEPSEQEVLFRVANYVQKHGGQVTSDDMWEVFGTDEGVAPFMKRRGGSCHWCRQHPDTFSVDSNVITLIGQVAGGGGSWGQRGYTGGYEPSEDEVLFRVANYVHMHGGSVTSEDMWEVFGTDEGIAPFMKRRGGSCHWCRLHPGIFTVDSNVINLIGQVRGFAGGNRGG